MALLEEESDAAVGEDALLHGEALLVVAAGDAEGISLPLVAQARRIHVLAHALLVERADLLEVTEKDNLHIFYQNLVGFHLVEKVQFIEEQFRVAIVLATQHPSVLISVKQIFSLYCQGVRYF